MPLFINRLPFASWTDQTRVPPQTHWTVVLPVLVTDAGLPAPSPQALRQDWALDTCLRGAAFAWRRHLLDARLDPDRDRLPGQVAVTTAVGGKQLVPIRAASLWLVSNLDAFRDQPWPLPLFPGVAFRDVPDLPDPHFHRPLIGLRTLRRAGLRIEIDCGKDTISVWTPDGP